MSLAVQNYTEEKMEKIEIKEEETLLETLERLKKEGKAPMWMTIAGFSMLHGGYLLDGETPYDMYWRISNASASRLGKPEWSKKFFDLFWKNYLCAASPVAANLGTDRGLPISCFGLFAPDSIEGIGETISEMRTLSKHGGGIGIHWGDVRPSGSPIKVVDGVPQNGYSKGPMPFIKEQDASTDAVDQGGTRNGNSVAYIDIEHKDVKDFIASRKKIGDHRELCENIHHGVVIKDSFMDKVYSGDPEATDLYVSILKMRMEAGEPYIVYIDNANRHLPESYIKNNLQLKASQLCTEIFLYMDEDHSFVCCLSSMNAANYEEWKDKEAAFWSTVFLDGVMQEFIDKISQKMQTDQKYGHHWRRVYNFSVKSRALGLGVLGWHSLLQSKMMPFDSFGAMMLNAEVFKHIHDESKRASKFLATMFGEPEWCVGTGMRNSHTMAVAPTRSNSLISGGYSKGIEPELANTYAENAAKGTYDIRNRYLEALLEEKGKNDKQTWDSIVNQQGSVQHLSFLSEEEKKVFLTAYEINQFAIIKQAAQRQKFIDQGQSLNLFFDKEADPRYIAQVHMAGHLSGLKSLYYCKSKSMIQADSGSRSADYGECASCEG